MISSAAGGDSIGAQRPYVLRAAVGLWGALAAFIAVQAGVAWRGFGFLQRRLVEQQGISAAEASTVAQNLLLVNTAIAVVLAACYAGFAWMMWKRRGWARIVLTALAAFHLLIVLGMAALTAPSLVVLALVGSAGVCSWRRSSTEWLAPE